MVETSNPEALQNPSPEEAAAMQQQECIFCHIVSGKVQSRKVYEDETCAAVLDINPANPGHMLLLPKKHYAIMPQVPEDIIAHMFMVAKHLSKACIKALKVHGTNIFLANGAAAGQKAQHVMIHIIPRKKDDNIQVFTLPHRQVPEEYLKKLHGILSGKLGKKPVPKQEVKKEQPKQEVKKEQPKQEVKKEQPKQEVKKEEPPQIGVDLDAITDAVLQPQKQEVDTDNFFASKKGGKYHLKNCPFLSRVKQENLIAIASEKEAQERELAACECVKNA